MFLKVRCWHKENKEMFVPYKILFNEDGTIKSIVHRWDDKMKFQTEYCPDEVDMMHYAGTKDNFRKEIYDGDIVDYCSSPVGGVHRGIVIFYGCGFKIRSSGGYIIDLHRNFGIIKVIGNKYETHQNWWKECDEARV